MLFLSFSQFKCILHLRKIISPTVERKKSVYNIALLYENYENNYSFLRLIPFEIPGRRYSVVLTSSRAPQRESERGPSGKPRLFQPPPDN